MPSPLPAGRPDDSQAVHSPDLQRPAADSDRGHGQEGTSTQVRELEAQILALPPAERDRLRQRLARTYQGVVTKDTSEASCCRHCPELDSARQVSARADDHVLPTPSRSPKRRPGPRRSIRRVAILAMAAARVERREATWAGILPVVNKLGKRWEAEMYEEADYLKQVVSRERRKQDFMESLTHIRRLLSTLDAVAGG